MILINRNETVSLSERHKIKCLPVTLMASKYDGVAGFFPHDDVSQIYELSMHWHTSQSDSLKMAPG